MHIWIHTSGLYTTDLSMHIQFNMLQHVYIISSQPSQKWQDKSSCFALFQKSCCAHCWVNLSQGSIDRPTRSYTSSAIWTSFLKGDKTRPFGGGGEISSSLAGDTTLSERSCLRHKSCFGLKNWNIKKKLEKSGKDCNVVRQEWVNQPTELEL